jgi:hypothetical protein
MTAANKEGDGHDQMMGGDSHFIVLCTYNTSVDDGCTDR